MPARYRTAPRSDRERLQRAGFQRWLSVYECTAEAWRADAEYETRL